ncbi:hypothetical protein KWH46_10280, partial [Escherichia coli]|uniref:hypothetical protein n=1 Tax=Escherichia coli TaxID=562 RepID=UPI0021D13955
IHVVSLRNGSQSQLESQINELVASTLQIFPVADFDYPFFFQAEAGIRDPEMSRGLGDVYKRSLHGDR